MIQGMIRKDLRLFNSLLNLSILFPFSLGTSQHANKPLHQGNMKADAILKNYFRNRSEMSNIMMVDLFDRLKNVKVGSGFFNDHRWIHLNVLIQKNLINFSITEQFKLLEALTRLDHYNQLFNSLFVNLIGKLESLQPNQKAALFYFKAKRGKTNPELVRKISDSLITCLKNKSLKITYPKQHNKSKTQQSEQQQQLFPDTNTVGQAEEISCRNLILCFWSLQKMRIKDNLLSNCILKQMLRPKIKEIPASLFPLLLSSLWLHGMQNKRIFNEITMQLKTRQPELSELDRDKVKMLICMLCKPEMSPAFQNADKQAQSLQKEQQKMRLSETRKILVLWLMETLIIKHEDKSQFLFSTTAYQILTNASEAKFIDIQLYQKYLALISSDLTKIQTKQVIYLLSIIQRLRNFWKRSSRTNQIPILCEKQRKILSQHLQANIFGFLQKFNELHPARMLLRKMTLSNFVEIPKNFKKKLEHQQSTLTQKSFSNRGKEKSEYKKFQTNQQKDQIPKRTSRKKYEKKSQRNHPQSQ